MTRERPINRGVRDAKPDVWRKCVACGGRGQLFVDPRDGDPVVSCACDLCNGLGEVLEDRPSRLFGGAL